MKLIFLLFKCKKVFLLIKNIFFVLYLLYDDECISYSTLDLIFFSYYSAMTVIYTVNTIHDQLEKGNVLAVTLFSFFLIFHVLSIIIHVF